MSVTQSEIETMYEGFFDIIYKFFYFKILSKEVAEDLTSETFIQFVKGLKEDKEIENLKAYLFGIAKIIFINYLKQKYKDAIPFSQIGDDFEDFLVETVRERDNSPSQEDTLMTFMAILILFGHWGNNLHGITARKWYEFFFIISGTDLLTNFLDEMIYIILNELWISKEEYRSYLYSLNGPLGILMNIFVINTFLINMAVPRSFQNWHLLMSTASTVCVLVVVKKFYQRLILDKLLCKS